MGKTIAPMRSARGRTMRKDINDLLDDIGGSIDDCILPLSRIESDLENGLDNRNEKDSISNSLNGITQLVDEIRDLIGEIKERTG
jgi:hypothetical protein